MKRRKEGERGGENAYELVYVTVAAAKSRQSCLTLCDPIDSSPPGSCLWDSPGKNTGVGCHFPLQCMNVKSESEVAQSCPTLCDPMDCSPLGSSVRGILQARVLEWGAIAFSEFMCLDTGKIKICEIGNLTGRPSEELML